MTKMCWFFLQAIYNSEIFEHFETKDYAGILDIVQKPLKGLSIFLVWFFKTKFLNSARSKCVPGGGKIPPICILLPFVSPVQNDKDKNTGVDLIFDNNRFGPLVIISIFYWWLKCSL